MARMPKKMLEANGDDVDDRGYHESIDLSMAENWLIREEVLSICKPAIEKYFDGHHLSMPTDFWGNPRLLKLLANLFNKYLAPIRTVQPAHITVSSGAATCLDTLLWNICDEGDGVLIPGPCWNGYDIHCRNRSATTPILVNFPRLQDAFSVSLVPALEKSFASAGCRIKALILTNPHNPLGQCYPKHVLEDCLQFCQRRSIHLISEEVFALSTFNPIQVDLTEPRHFVSMLAIDPIALNCDPGRVHIVWSMSKDFAAGGIKLGCTITQGNTPLRNGLAMATFMNVSTLSTVFANALLSSKSLPGLVKLNSVRLAEAYHTLTSFFDRYGIYYIPCNAGYFVMAKLAPQASSREDEAALIYGLSEVGVLVSPGQAYHMDEKGWARVSFAVERAALMEAIQRMRCVLPSISNTPTQSIRREKKDVRD